MIIDIHSHTIGNNPQEKIISLRMKDSESALIRDAAHISAGIHPWFLSEEDLDKQIRWVKDMAESDRRVVAIGECGTDKVCNTPMTLQTAAFKSMIGLSEELELPLIIHSVRTYNEIISLKKQLKPEQKWIIHGFRGKKETAIQLINHGIYISIGEKFNTEAVKHIPSDMLLIESDESSCSINQIAENIALCTGITAEELIKITAENTNSLFFSR